MSAVARLPARVARGDARGPTVVAVRDRVEPRCDDPAALDCVLGEHVWLDPSGLETFYFRALEAVEQDLILLTGAVAFADRKVTRGRGARWARNLLLRMPVLELARWRDPAVESALRGALEHVTGDRWQFEFVPRRGRAAQGLLPLRRPLEGRLSVVPYSGGLDSFAALRLTGAGALLAPVAFTADNSTRLRRLTAATTDPLLGPYQRVRLPVRLKIGEHGERTCRARTFVFLIGAALTARLAGAEEVQVPENGQGSVGLSVLPESGELPYQGTHPAYTQRLHEFLRALWGEAPAFRHPHLWDTKADVLRRLRERDLLAGWEATRSCSRAMDREKRRGVRAQCGVCCNCLLRRVALHAVGLSGVEPYVWSRLESAGLAGALGADYADCSTAARDHRIALGAVRDHQTLAEGATARADRPTFQQTVYETARALGMPSADVAAQLDHLLRRHRDDWASFLATLPPESWVRRAVGGG